MEFDDAIRKMMLSIRTEEFLPEKFYYYVKERMEQIYVAGWEQGRYEINQHGNKPIGQFYKTSEGAPVNIFKSRIDAAKKTGFSEAGIKKCMIRRTPMKQGWIWRYLEDSEIPPEMKKSVPRKNWLI